MATMNQTIAGTNGGGITVDVGYGSTGADLTVQGPDGGPVAAFVGGPSLLALASKCAAIAQGVNDGPQDQPLYALNAGYGTSCEGQVTLTPGDGEVAVELKLTSGPRAQCTVDLSDVATLGQVLAAAGHDL